ncbi:Cysteine-rich secretory protein family [Candidatus Methanoperedens nitroreducens]|uniref:Cysteine-rich secretory protein family n=1 Tax=Candidatus Methanoperedens nitratireducens TaxID=1392998 RepID=A0A062V806_9EURY|nr:CAP domain-containing protein [Candidatus Methanoperedens nitroreducens]KCZ73417.1 Cysteine-rich secretory protein family [Candidatus Methanoperedens nitroreducens]MDJ1422628.1 CAP domain-containing protein [Candidatus Methanoperedens sp.]
MSFKNTLILFLITLVIFTAGCISSIIDSSYTMRFFINGTNEPLEGGVFNNDNLLGYTQDGSFNTSLDKLRPGLIALNGTYDNQPFEFYFEFPRENLNYSGIDFSVNMDDIKKVLFNASLLDIPELEHTIFDLINEKRRASGTKVLKWNDRIAPIAKNYSRTLSIEGFHHKDLEGKDAGDRLKENRIFYTIVAENLYMISGLNDTVNISETMVNGWMSSPGHRSPIVDRDELFSDGAVGVYCEKKTCYATMVFAGMENERNIQLKPGYLTFFYLYDPSYLFDFDVPAFVEIDSTEYINMYFVSGREQYENFINGRNFQAISENRRIRKFSSTVIASKGEGIIIESGGNNAEINIRLRYS